MGKLLTTVMYSLWVITIIAVLTTTFTGFQYEDLNIIAIVLFAFTFLNSFFAASKR